MKRVIRIVSIVLMILLAWYLFIRPFEYSVKFKANTLPGDIIQTVRLWSKSSDALKVIDVDTTLSLVQKVKVKDRSYTYNWNFNALNDTLSQVNIEISQEGRSIVNKLLIPFSDQPIEEDAREVAFEFYDILKEHVKITNVKIDGMAVTRKSFCVCSTLKTKQTEKAQGMMFDYGLLTSHVADNKLEPDGPPLVEIVDWDHSKNKLIFNFCMPIEKQDSLPGHDRFFYKEFEKQKSLRAIYNGNYITSDRAWYSLLRHAKKNELEVIGNPIEYFYNNPNLGINEEDWKAEIYLPIK